MSRGYGLLASLLVVALWPGSLLVVRAEPSRERAAGTCTFSNGGLNPQAVSESGVPAPAGRFWSELQHDAGNAAEANGFTGFFVDRLAEDFTLNTECRIGTISFYSLIGATDGSRFTFLRIRIWRGLPEQPGSTIVFGDWVTNRLASSADTGYLRIFNTVAPPPGTSADTTRPIWRITGNVNTTLSPGTYWVEWAASARDANGFNISTVYPALTVPGGRGAPEFNARAYYGITGWNPIVLDLGSPLTAPDVPQGFPFDIAGTTTAAGVGLSGRVIGPNGLALRGVIVTVTSSGGERRTATTGSFGYYSFDGIQAGASYVVSANSKRYRFAPRVITITDTLAGIDFVGLE